MNITLLKQRDKLDTLTFNCVRKKLCHGTRQLSFEWPQQLQQVQNVVTTRFEAHVRLDAHRGRRFENRPSLSFLSMLSL